MFAQQLAAAGRLQAAQVARYGVTADQLEAVKTRCVQWAADLRQASTDPAEDPPGALAEHMLGQLPEAGRGRHPAAAGQPTARPAQQPRDPDRGIEL